MNLIERVRRHTMSGDPADCWGWGASSLPNGRPRLGVRLPGGKSTSVTAARVIVADREGLDPLDRGEGARWVARHSCDNVACVNPAHLLSGTYADNVADMWQRGRGARGDRRPSSRLSADLVRSIRARIAAGESQGSIARDLGIGQGHVSQVHRGIVWGWVK